MRHAVAIVSVLLCALPILAGSLTYTGECSNGCTSGEDWTHDNGNEVKTAVDDNDSRLDNLGDCSTSPCDLTSGTTINGSAALVAETNDVETDGAANIADTEIIVGTGAGTTNYVAVSGDATLANTGALTVTGGDVDTAAALAANGTNCSAGSYPLGVDASGAVESCTDATTEIDSVVATKSAATSTDNAIARFDSTAGDIQNSGVTIDDSNNLSVPGDLDVGSGSGAACLILRDSDDAGDSACEVLNGTFSCETDTNGICGDAT